MYVTLKEAQIEWKKKVEDLELQVNEMANKLVSKTEGSELKEKVKLCKLSFKHVPKCGQTGCQNQ